MLILILVVVTAVCFDFTNGFHDTANAVATSIATGALKPRMAVLMSAVLNLVGAFLSIKVAAAILSPLICFLVAATATFVVYRMIRYLKEGEAARQPRTVGPASSTMGSRSWPAPSASSRWWWAFMR